MSFDLHPGEVLSYSAGSTQTGPEGFRKVGARRGNLLDVAAARWPELRSAMGARPALFINAYPAPFTFSPGITVDTYLSPRVLTRALQLGKVAEHPVILAGQPLFLADALRRHVLAGHALPETLMLWVGGYVMFQSLERSLSAMLAPHLRQLLVVHYFGAAEVDAGCMMARERDASGELIYHPRPDVTPELDGEGLVLTLRDAGGATVMDRFPTGDLARRCGEGFVIWNDKRLHPRVHAALESWSGEDWQRRTGYVRRDGDTIWIQLREGEAPRAPEELAHFDFAGRFGFAWVEKPFWR